MSIFSILFHLVILSSCLSSNEIFPRIGLWNLLGLGLSYISMCMYKQHEHTSDYVHTWYGGQEGQPDDFRTSILKSSFSKNAVTAFPRQGERPGKSLNIEVINIPSWKAPPASIWWILLYTGMHIWSWYYVYHLRITKLTGSVVCF